jgi:hypothetical protein
MGLSAAVDGWFSRLGRLTGLKRRGGPPFLRLRRAYAPPPALARQAPAAFMAPVSQGAGADAPPGGRLYALWSAEPDGHKLWHYFAFYEQVIGPLATRPLRLLEIGVWRGASLSMWSRWLPEGSVVVGLDHDPAVARFDRPQAGIHVRVGDQADAAFLGRVAAEFGPFDVVVDDGGHVAGPMIESFNALFLDALAPGGVYIVEDLCTQFWEAPWRDRRDSFFDYAKALADAMHWHHFGRPRIEAFTLGDPSRLAAIETPRIAGEIAEVRFRDSIVAISRRAAPGLPVIERR